MAASRVTSWIKCLLRPSAKYSILALAAMGIAIGLLGTFAFDYSMHATSTEEFCISCHEMETGPYAQLLETPHYKNSSGVRPTCSDCHLPKEFGPKMIRKIEASREVWGTLTGIIDTPEKYAAHTPIMKAREIARMQANDSQECRNCHDVKTMDLDLQSKMARRSHASMQEKNKTCIDCHDGLAHAPLN